MAVYTTIDNPELYFQTKLYTGNGGTLAITLDGDEDMQPDFVWSKPRVSGGHFLSDSIRGGTKVLQAAESNAEITRGSHIQSFDTDGYTLAGDGTTNNSGDATVSWNWKAGTAFSNDASATGIGTIDSSGSVNETAGFSIVSYTGSGSAATIKHGLSTTPNMMIIKNRVTDSKDWQVYSPVNDPTDALALNQTDATGDSDVYWNDTAPTSSVFSVKSGATNTSGAATIGYIFSNRQGYSKFGSYTGNGNANGTFVYTGFKPAMVICKKSSASGTNWGIIDNKRANSFNQISAMLNPNSNGSEGANNNCDFVSNGFKWKTSDGNSNDSATYIYMAFAESPFVNSNGVPTNAR